ncbi:MAG: hypothetical protein ABIJ96_08940 [Elusimicrobiota bacterium]
MRKSAALLLAVAVSLQPVGGGLSYAAQTVEDPAPLTAEFLDRLDRTIADSFTRAKLDAVDMDAAALRARIAQTATPIARANLNLRIREIGTRHGYYQALLSAVAAQDKSAISAQVGLLGDAFPALRADKEGLNKTYQLLAEKGLAAVTGEKTPQHPNDNKLAQGLQARVGTMNRLPAALHGKAGGDKYYDGSMQRGAAAADPKLPGGPDETSKTNAAGMKSSDFQPRQAALTVSDVPMSSRSTKLEADRYGTNSPFMNKLALSFHTAAANVTLPGALDRSLDAVRAQHKGEAYRLTDDQITTDRGQRTAEFISGLGADTPDIKKLQGIYQEAVSKNDPELMRKFLDRADNAITRLDAPALRGERDKRTSYAAALEETQTAMNSFAGLIESRRPEMKSSLMKLADNPGALSEGEWAGLQDAFQEHRDSPEFKAFMQARAQMNGARAGLDEFYAANPLLARYRADLASSARFHWQAMLGGLVKDGTWFSPHELQAHDVPPGASLVKGTETGRAGLWTMVGGKKTSFKSFDGRYTAEQFTDAEGTPLERRITANKPGQAPDVEIINQGNKKGGWKRHVGTLAGGKFVHAFTEYKDGSFDLDTEALFAAERGAARQQPAADTAGAIVKLLGWKDEGGARSGPLAQWLADGYSKGQGIKAMRLRAQKDGTLHVIYERSGGAQEIRTAKFAKASKFQDQDMGEALVVLKKSWIRADGSKDIQLQRTMEYLPDGSRLLWNEQFESTEAGWVKSRKNHTRISLKHVKRRADGTLDWNNAGVERRAELDLTEDVDTTSTLGMVSAALHDTPALGHALKGLGWVGDRGYNGVVGGYQGLIGEIADSPIYRVHGMAGSKRMVMSRDDERWENVAASFGRREKAVIDGDVHRLRSRHLSQQGLQRERMLDDKAYQDFRYREITDKERGHTLATAVGAGTYGQYFADLAAEETGINRVLYETAGVGMTTLESIPQTLPVLLALGPLGKAAGTGSWAVRGVSLARVGHAVVTPYVMTSWGVNIPLGVNDFVEGIQEGDPHKTVRGGGQALTDALFLAVAAKDFAKTLKSQRTQAQVKNFDKALTEPQSAPKIKPKRAHNPKSAAQGKSKTVAHPVKETVKARGESKAGREVQADALMEQQVAKRGEYLESRKTDAKAGRETVEQRQTRALEERALAKKAYSEAVEIGKGAKESPVSEAGVDAAIAEGTLAENSNLNVAQQGSQTCALHAWTNHLNSAGVKITLGEVFKVVEQRLGPELLQKAKTQGLSQAETMLVYKAVALEKGISLERVPAGKVFSKIAQEGNSASMTMRTGEGHHQVVVEGVVQGKNGGKYVSYIDSQTGGRTFMPVELFAKLARSDGLVAGKKAAPQTYAEWRSEFKAFKKGKIKFAAEKDAMKLEELVDGGETARVGQGEAPPPMKVMEALDKLLDDPANIAKIKDNPNAYRNILGKMMGGKKQASKPLNEAQIVEAQRAYKQQLMPEAKKVLERYNLTEADVVSHGTSLQGLMGMIFEGGIRASDSFGDGAKHWAAKGTGGATYIAAPAGRGEPGVVVIIENKGNRLGHTIDYTAKSPQVMSDFLAVIITDGAKTVVLDKAQLMTLGSSAKAWKTKVSDYNQPGWKMSDFSAWEKYQKIFESTKR